MPRLTNQNPVLNAIRSGNMIRRRESRATKAAPPTPMPHPTALVPAERRVTLLLGMTTKTDPNPRTDNHASATATRWELQFLGNHCLPSSNPVISA